MSRLIQSMEFRDINFSFDGQEKILNQVSIPFPLGEVISLRGDRGAGRSTFLQMLAGLQMPDGGEFLINGENVLDWNFEDFLPYRLKIGYTFDLGGLISNRTLNDNLLLPLNYHRICSPAEAQKKVDYYIDKFGLTKSRDMRPATVSGGIRKLTCLIRSLLLEPEILLLDDMTVGISKPLVDLYWGAVEDLRKAGKNHTVIFSSYDESFMQQIETISLYFEGGQVFLHSLEKKVVHL